MMSAEDCLRKAFEAILRGDAAERDRYCELAVNIMNAKKRLDQGIPAEEAVCVGVPITVNRKEETNGH